MRRSSPRIDGELQVVALAGGVGGARFAHGLQSILGRGELTVIVNTGDDFELYGLLICPDHDTVMYTLAGLVDPIAGWGIAGDTRASLDQLARYGEPTWFQIGDRDLATHLVRTSRLRAGERLTEALLHLQQALGLASRILPMADDPVRTHVLTDDGWLEFQDYFVRRRQEPAVRGVRFDGATRARRPAEADAAIAGADLIVICPSNPIVSIGPILAIGGPLADAAQRTSVVAISPIVGGRAIKGPADRMLASLGHEVSALGVARIYRGLASHFVLDVVDEDLEGEIRALGLRTLVTDTIMTDAMARARLARAVLDFVTGSA